MMLIAFLGFVVGALLVRMDMTNRDREELGTFRANVIVILGGLIGAWAIPFLAKLIVWPFI